MEVLRILEKKGNLDWEYDEEADVLYISMGVPVPALGLDIGEGIMVRYSEKTREVVGLTILGMRKRTMAAVGGVA